MASTHVYTKHATRERDVFFFLTHKRETVITRILNLNRLNIETSFEDLSITSVFVYKLTYVGKKRGLVDLNYFFFC